MSARLGDRAFELWHATLEAWEAGEYKRVAELLEEATELIGEDRAEYLRRVTSMSGSCC